MGDAFNPEPEGALLSGLSWLDKPGRAIRSAFKGNFSGALRNAGDFLLDPIDALLPGDIIPELARPEDKTSGSDLVGLDKEAHPFLGFLGDVGIGTLTDPITWLGVAQELIPGGQVTGTATIAASLAKHAAQSMAKGATEEAAKAAALAAVRPGFSRAALKVGVPFTKIQKTLPHTGDALAWLGDKAATGIDKYVPQELQDLGSRIAQKTRLTLDAPRIGAANEALINAGDAAAGLVQSAGQADVKRLIDMIPDPALRQHAFDVANNLKGNKPGEYAELLPGSNVRNPLLDIIPEDAGAPLSDVARSQPADDYLRVRPEKPARDDVAAIDAGLGLHKMPLPVGELADLISKDVKNPSLLDVTHPGYLTDPRYASGVDVANRNVYQPDLSVRTYGSDSLKPSPSELPRQATGIDAVNQARAAADRQVPAGGLSGMLGATKTRKAYEEAMVKDPLTGEMKSVSAKSIPMTDTFDTVEGHLARYSQRIDAMPIGDAEKAALKSFWAEALPHVQEQFARDVQNGILSRPQGRDILRQMPADYVQRRFTGMLSDKDLEMVGNPNAIHARTIKDPGQLPSFMNANPEVKLDRDIGSAFGHRVEQDARMTKSTVIGKQLIEQYAKQADEKIFKAQGDVSKIGLTKAESDALAARGTALADTEFRTATTSIVDHIKKVSPHTEDGILLENAIKGNAPRGAATAFIAKSLAPFKPYAVYGAFVPKLGADVRNALTGVVQVGSNPETRSLTGQTIKNLPHVLFGSLMDGIEKMTGARIGHNEFGEVEAAFKQAKGDPGRALALIQNPMMREAVKNNVIDNGFVRAETLTKESDRLGWSKWWRSARDWPAVFFKGVEQRMRYGLYKGLRETKGFTEEQAARATSGTLYSYKTRSAENRLARDVIPFFQFQAKAGVQTAKLIGEQPSVGVALSQALSGDRGPLYPWMEGKTNIPLGQDEQGNDQYATGLGLPFESLNMIPSSWRDFEKNVIGSSSPVIKSLYSAASGHDPYFQTAYGSYDKIPGIGAAGDVGQLYNKVAQTGVIQPIDSVLRAIGGITDDRHSLPVKALDLLTGVNVASVDPDLALQKQLQELLANNPDVMQHRSFYQQSDDPQVQAILEAYKGAKARVKAKRSAAAKQ